MSPHSKLNKLYTPSKEQPRASIVSQECFTIESRIYDIIQWKQQGISTLNIDELPVVYKKKNKHIVVFGMDVSKREADSELLLSGSQPFTGTEIKTVQVFSTEMIDYYKYNIHAEICKQENLSTLLTPIIFEKEEGSFVTHYDDAEIPKKEAFN